MARFVSAPRRLLVFLAVLPLIACTASAQVVYVDCNAPGPSHDGTSWDTAFLTIQEGVDAATPGGEVWVADGTYVENVVMGEAVELYGGFLGAEEGGYEDSLDQRDFTTRIATIDGNGTGSCVAMARNAVVDGLTIIRGSGTEDSWGHLLGGGVYCCDLGNDPGQSTAIRNNLISSNTAADAGGGVYCCGSAPTIADNTITDNSAVYGGAVFCPEDSSPTIANNTITGNSALDDGGAVYCEHSSPTVANNTITGNSAVYAGGAVFCYASSPTIADNTITDNSATDGYGGAVFCVVDSSPTIANNAFNGNSAAYSGGAVCCWESLPTIANNAFNGNSAVGGGGGVYCSSCSPTIANNTITGNSAGDGGAVSCRDYSSPTIANNTITRNSAAYGGAVSCVFGSAPSITNNTITDNSATYGGAVSCCYDSSSTITNNALNGNSAVDGGGIYCYGSSPMVTNNAITGNSAGYGGGIFCEHGSSPALSHNDFWSNLPDNYYGCVPGEGDISADPMFANPDLGDWHLTLDSPCIDAGWNGAPGLPETDWDGEERIVNGLVDIGADEYVTYYTEAPDPQPECSGPLFGGSQAGFPAWVWFSIPLTPDCVVGSGCGDPTLFLGHGCSGRLWYFDKYLKCPQVYQPPFLTWDLAVGDSYLLYLETDVVNPGYDGITPFIPWTFEFKLGRQGWTWVGMPGPAELARDEFMSSVGVLYPSDETGEYRTAQADYDAIPDNWLSWGWPYWNTWRQAAETFTPYAPFGHRTCYPWVGYRVWVNVGIAQSENDPGQVTLIWPKTQ